MTSTASENIVNIIIFFLSLIFKIVILVLVFECKGTMFSDMLYHLQGSFSPKGAIL